MFTNDIFALIQYLPIDILSILKRKLLNIILINIWRKKNHSRLNICSKKRTLLYVKSSPVFIQYDIIYIYIINSIKGILILKRLLDITVMYFQYFIRQFHLVLEYMPYTTVMLQLTKEKANTSLLYGNVRLDLS